MKFMCSPNITHFSSIFAFILAIGSARAQQPTEGWSDSGKLKFEVRGPEGGPKEVWIVPENKDAGAVKMAETMGWGNLRVHISPDDSRIILQDGGGSIGIDLRVFRKDGDGKFVEEVKWKIGSVLESWAMSKTKAPEGTILGHRYIKLHGWSADSSKILVSISGHEGKWQIPGWFAIYEFGTGKLSFDLSTLNG